MGSSAKPNRDGIEVVHVLPKLVQSLKNLLPKKGKQIPNNEEIDDMTTNIINQVTNVVDLSVTGMKSDDLKTFWGTLEKFKNLTSLEVAMAPQSSITLQDCGRELKKNLKRLQMEATKFSIGSSSVQPLSGLENLGAFTGLIDLTLTSDRTIEVIDKIPCIPTLQCLRLYGDSRKNFCEIKLQGFVKLRKLVIGDMGLVQTVQIGSAVIKNIDTLELYKLPELSKVVYSREKQSLLRWEKSTKKCAHTVKLTQTDKLDETIFLRRFKPFPSGIRKDLMIYHYDMDEQCYKYIVCEST